MIDDNDGTEHTHIDQSVDLPIEKPQVSPEKYDKGIADSPRPNTESEDSLMPETTLNDIERMVNAKVLGNRDQKLVQFGIQLDRKNDFRLRTLSERLGDRLSRTYQREMTTGATPQKIRNFDIQAQTIQQIVANTALSSLQFQKTKTLPYMRKNLALSYHRNELLKKMVSGIAHLETSIVSKLEAIKMNTAAPEVKKNKGGFFTKLRADIKEARRKKIANNIANVSLFQYDKLWKKYANPLFTSIDKIMHTDGPKGGFNGTAGFLTTKLNRMRHQVRQAADATPTNAFDRIKVRAAQMASAGLNQSVRLGQKIHVGAGVNSVVSKPLRAVSSFMGLVDPFGGHGFVRNPNAQPIPQTSGTPGSHTPDIATNALTRILAAWKKDYRQDQDTVIGHLAAIQDLLSGHQGPPSSGPIGPIYPSGPSSPKPSGLGPVAGPASSSRSIRATVAAKLGALPKPSIPRVNIRFPKGPNRSTLINAMAAARANTVSAGVLAGAAVGAGLPLLGGLTHHVSSGIAHGVHALVGHAHVVAPHIATAGHSLENRLMQGIDTLHGHAHTVKEKTAPHWEKIRSGVQSLSTKIGKMGESLKVDKKKTERTEKTQRNFWTSLLKKPSTRKGSYEDLHGHDHDGEDPKSWRDKVKGYWDRNKGRGVVGGATQSYKNSSLSKIAGWAGGAAMFAGKSALKYGWKGGKFLAKNGLKAGASVAGKAGMGALRMGGGFLKGGGGVAIAGMIGKHFVDKYTTGKTRRVGDTLADAASWGATGFMLGGPIGAAIGAGVGVAIANSDYVIKGFQKLGSGLSKLNNAHKNDLSNIFHGIFGQSAQVTASGHVLRQEKTSLLGDLRTAFFGRQAKYSKSGELISPTKRSMFGLVSRGFEKAFFGDKFNNGQYKYGTSLVAQAATSLQKTIAKIGGGLAALPHKLAKGAQHALDKTKAGVSWTGRKIHAGAQAVATGVTNAYTAVTNATSATVDAAKNLGNAKGRQNLKDRLENWGSNAFHDVVNASPIGFIMQGSAAVSGWALESGAVNAASSPLYPLVTALLKVYGVSNRALYKALHYTETLQDQINQGKAKPYDEDGIAFIAGTLGFDSKNKDALAYFKLWYKNRFIPTVAIVSKVLRGYKLDVGSVLSASPNQIPSIIKDITSASSSLGSVALGLDLSAQVFNKFSKSGSKAPDHVAGAPLANNKPYNPSSAKPFDPDAGIRGDSGNGGRPGLASGYGSNGSSGQSNQPAGHKQATMSKGTVKDQPEFKAAYSKLPANLKKVVDKSAGLQFTLWSTSVQHGSDTAAKIFVSQYSDGLTDKRYIDTIYQRRSNMFGDLQGSDRAAATQHLGQEMGFADSIDSGKSMPTMDQMGQMAGRPINPSGDSSQPFNGTAAKVSGTQASRAKDAIQYLMAKKWSKNAAMGIVANLIQESGLRTNLPGDNGAALGLAQWHSDRRSAIAKALNKPFESLDFHGQLDGVDLEMKGGGRGGVPKGFAEKLNAMSDPGAAAVAVMQTFERPKDHASNGTNAHARAAIAMGLLKNEGVGTSKPNQTPATGSSGSGATPSAAPAKAPAAKAAAPSGGGGGASSPGPDLSGHTQALNDNTQAIKNLHAVHAAAAANTPSAPSGDTHHNTVVAPTIHTPQPTSSEAGVWDTWLKKLQTAVS